MKPLWRYIYGWGWLITGIMLSAGQTINIILVELSCSAIVYGLVRYREWNIVNLIGWISGLGLLTYHFVVKTVDPANIIFALILVGLIDALIKKVFSRKKTGKKA